MSCFHDKNLKNNVKHIKIISESALPPSGGEQQLQKLQNKKDPDSTD